MSSGKRPSKNQVRPRRRVLITIALIVMVLAPFGLLIGLASEVEAAHLCRDSSHYGAIVRLLCGNIVQTTAADE